MKYFVCLIVFLLALTTVPAAETAPAEERVEVLVPVGENLKAGGLIFRVSATEFQHNQVHFHVVIAGEAGHLLNATSLQARLGFDFWDHGRRIGRTREVALKPDGLSLVCDFSVHAGWLIDNSLCFVVTKLEAASVPLLSCYLYPGRFWDPDRCLRDDYDALSVYQKTPSFFGYGHDENEITIDLNGDGRPEKLLLSMTHAHWGHYSIFTYHNKKWRYIGDARVGDNPRLARNTHHGWRDFTVDINGSRGQVSRSYYRWDVTSNEYEEIRTWEIRPMEHDPSLEP
jgi:hypothetical protein